MRFLVPLLLILAVGCTPQETAKTPEKPKQPDLAGAWHGKVVMGEKDRAKFSEEDLKQAEEQLKAFEMDLEIMADGTYKVSTKADSSEGKWTAKDDLLTLETFEPSANPGEQPDGQKFTIEDGGNLLVGTDPSGESDSQLVFTRA